jgi:hypothetical protein
MNLEQRSDDHTNCPATPREAAKDLIRLELRRGNKLANILEEHPSTWWQTTHYSATVGGTIFRQLGTPEAEFLPLEIDQIGVRKLAGMECWAVFPLREIYAEVWQEEHAGADLPELMEQGQLL